MSENPPEMPPPAVVLVEPQLGENIGAVARAMANFGLSDLRLVRPRDGWPNARAYAVSSGAHWPLDGARVFQTTAEALAGLTLVPVSYTHLSHGSTPPGGLALSWWSRATRSTIR